MKLAGAGLLLLIVFTGFTSASTEIATFSMFWYWTGEATLGRVSGILSSKIGHLNGSEIVRVEFDSAQTNLQALVQALRNQSSFYSLITKNEAERDQATKILNSTKITVDSTEPDFIESKYTLKSSHPELYYLDLTEQQAIVLNSWSYFGGRKPEVLTDSQKQLLLRLKEKLAKKSLGRLVPRRSGNELAAYRSQLLQWLQE